MPIIGLTTWSAERNIAMKNKNWWKAAGWRALRTVAQTALATIGTTTVLTGVDWLLVLNTTALAGVLSVLTSIIKGIPEADE